MSAEDVVVVFIPAGVEQRRWLDACTRYCERHRLRVLHITRDGTTAARLVVNGDVDRAVVAHPAHAELMMPAVEVASWAERRGPTIYGPPDRARPEWTDPGTRRTSRRPERLDRPRPHWRTNEEGP